MMGRLQYWKRNRTPGAVIQPGKAQVSGRESCGRRARVGLYWHKPTQKASRAHARGPPTPRVPRGSGEGLKAVVKS